MKTLKTINEKFDEKFNPYEGFRFENVQNAVKSFFSSQIKELLEELVMEKKDNPLLNDWCIGYNDCRSELQEKIKKIIN